MGVKYCFRYNQRNRRHQHDENGEPIDMATIPRTHRRRREKKLMTMDEVNDRFPLTKYKAWMSSRAEEGLPTAGGVAVPHSPTASLRHMEGATSAELDRTTTADKERPMTPSSSAPQEKDKPVEDSPTNAVDEAAANKHATPSQDAPKIHNEEPTPESNTTTSPPSQAAETTTTPMPTSPPAVGQPTRQEVQDDNDMDDDDQIQIAVPTELLANPGDSCAICIDTLEDDDDVRGLTCGHAFHASCLDPWLTSRRACCPLCKADYYVPKPRPEGEAPAEAERHAGRRQLGANGARVDGIQPPQYAFMSRRDGRPRMILPGRFMTIGHFDDNQRYGFPTVQRHQRPSRSDGGQNVEQPEARPAPSNTWRSRIPTFNLPRPSIPGRFRRSNHTSEGSGLGASPEIHSTTQHPTPRDLENGRQS